MTLWVCISSSGFRYVVSGRDREEAERKFKHYFGLKPVECVEVT